jgi:hypothetical protein
MAAEKPAEKPQDLEDLLSRLEDIASTKGAKVSVDEVYRAVGERSFGPLLLVVGLVGMTPISAIPTAPSILALLVILIAGQLLVGRHSLWLPKRVLKMSLSAGKFRRSLAAVRRPVHALDSVMHPRLCFLTGGIGHRVVALACVVVAATVPPLELLPFVAVVPATAIAAFGLGLVTRDGIVISLAFAATFGALALVGRQLLA